MRKIELLAPARSAEVGIEAFNHGADAVYIGAPAFSARAAAGNSVSDIERMARHGHRFGAKTLVALNTILTDAELHDAERLTWQLYEAGVDALIVQDLGLLQMHLPPIELHASTQMDNRTPDKVRLLRDLGMTRVVMARELSVEQIRAIHEAVPDVELECFVHGALCVCISGQCYMSAALTGRSANRGECAQPCRLPMDLVVQGSKVQGARFQDSRLQDSRLQDSRFQDSNGEILVAQQRHLLSLRDMNRSAYIGQLIAAGVTSLKIEGRLKDMSYVKNVVASYRRLIDEVVAQHNLGKEAEPWMPASMGHCTYTFEPRLEKSFNRGFTPYFAAGEREPMWNFESPKAMGERVGVIERVMRDSFAIRLDKAANGSPIVLHNGDGLAVGALGFRLNRFDPSTSTCYLLEGAKVCQQLRPGLPVWRNMDTAFDQLLAKPSARRVMPIRMHFRASADGLKLSLCLSECPEVKAEVQMEGKYEQAQKPQDENMRRQLSKLGDTVFEVEALHVEGREWFVPSSQLAELRRQGCDALTGACEKVQTALRTGFRAHDYAQLASTLDASGILPTSFLANVMNGKAREMYAKMQVGNVDDAFELQHDKTGMVMQTRHCLKYAFGQCPRYANPNPEKMLSQGVKLGSEATLKIGGKKFILKFGCKNDCISEIFCTFAASRK